MGRMVWAVTVALMVAALGWAWFVVPESGVPMQTDFDGTVTRYGTRTEFLGTFAGLSVLTVVLTPLICVFALQGDAPLLNMPNKDYWLAPERAEATKADVADRLWWFLAATNLLMVFAVVDTVLLGTRGHDLAGPVPFLVYLAYATWWAIALLRRFRLPEDR